MLTADSLEPLGGEVIPYANLDMLDRHLDLFTDMLRVLRGSGVHVEYFFPEYQGGVCIYIYICVCVLSLIHI